MADTQRNIEQQREVWLGFANGQVDGLLHLDQVESTPVALIGQRGIVKTVAQNNRAPGQGGADCLLNKLRPAGVHEQQLGVGRDRLVAGGVLDHVADGFADGRAARLTERDGFPSGIGQSLGQSPNLGGFSTPLDAFERDEQATHFRAGLFFKVAARRVFNSRGKIRVR